MQVQNSRRNCRSTMGYLIIGGKRYPVYKGINTIGRCITATVPLKTLNVSKQHAIITVVREDEHYISDFQSFNGTYLKKSKLVPLVLNELLDNSVIEFGSVGATYSKISTSIGEDNNWDVFHNTQNATQSLYDANTQVFENEVPNQNSTMNIQQPENLFDDDYSFDDISTQMINESVKSKSPVFKVPLSIHEVETQKLCDENIPRAEDPTDIHNMETQKFEMSSKFEFSCINEIPTQMLEKEQDFDITSIIDETVLETSEVVVTTEIPENVEDGTQDSDSQSKLHVSQLNRRTSKPLADTEESNPINSEVICNTQASEDDIKCKPRKKLCIIESDSETDVEDLGDITKNDSGSDTDVENLQTVNKDSSPTLNYSTPEPPIANPQNIVMNDIDSDTDIDDFQFNTETIRSSPKQQNFDLGNLENDDIIPGTQFADEEVFNENPVVSCIRQPENTKMVNSVDDMDSLYLEATQLTVQDNSLNELNESIMQTATQSVDVRKESTSESVPENNGPKECFNSEKLSTSQENECFVKPRTMNNDNSQALGMITPAVPESNIKKTDLRGICEQESSLTNMNSLPTEFGASEDLFMQPTQAFESDIEKNVFLKPADPPNINAHKNKEDDIFLQPTQVIECEIENDVYLEPTQPLAAVRGQKSKEDDIFLQPTQVLESNRETNVFLEPRQRLTATKGQKGKDDDIFLQPTQLLESGTETNLMKDLKGKDDDIFLRPTQVLESDTETNVFSEPTQPLTIMKSQKNKDNVRQSTQVIECDTENNVYFEPTQPLSVTKDLKNKEEDIFLQPTQVLDSGSEPNVTKDQKGKDEDIFMQPTQVLESNTEVNVFSEPTQLLTLTKDQKIKDKFLKRTQQIGISETQSNVESKLQKMFASQNPSLHSEIESQLEVEFESQNVSYRTDISNRPLNPLLNEFRDKNSEGLENSEILQVNSEIVTEKDETIVAGSDVILSTEQVQSESITESLTGNNKPKKASLSLQKRDSSVEKENCDENHFPSTLPLDVSPSAKIDIDENLTRKSSGTSIKTNQENKNGNNISTSVVIREMTEERDIEAEEEIVPSTKQRHSKKNSNTSTTKGPVQKRIKKASSNDQREGTEKYTFTDTTSIAENIKTRSTRAAKAAVAQQNDINKENDSNKRFKSRTRSAQNKPKEFDESDNDAPKVTRTKSKVEKKPKRGIKTLANVDDAIVIENNNDLDSVPNKESRSRSTKDKHFSQKKDGAVSSTIASDDAAKSVKKKSQRSVKTAKEVSESADLEVMVSEKPTRTRASKNKKITNIEPLVTNEAIACSSNTKNNSIADDESHNNIATTECNMVNINSSADASKTNKSNRKKKSSIEVNELNVDSEVKKPLTATVKDAHVEAELNSTPLRTTRKKRIIDSVPDTPQKRLRGKTTQEVVQSPIMSQFSESSSTGMATPDRNRRKQKPKVVFTMLDSPELESVIRSLGGTVVNSVETCTVLVTGTLKRTQKLLSAVGQAKPICSPQWLQECKKANQFLDPWDYILEDKNAEDNWNLSLKESLIKSQTQKLFHDYIVYVAVTNSVDVLKAAVESCGGKCVTKAPSKITSQNFIVVANPENKSKFSKFLQKEPPVKVVMPEAIFDGVLRQELRLDEYLLS